MEQCAEQVSEPHGAVRGARVRDSESHAFVEQRVSGAEGQWRADAGSSGVKLAWDAAGRGALGQVRASETMMGPEFENPANNWYRSSGDRVYQYGGGG